MTTETRKQQHESEVRWRALAQEAVEAYRRVQKEEEAVKAYPPDFLRDRDPSAYLYGYAVSALRRLAESAEEALA